jgi:hypothetical protein
VVARTRPAAGAILKNLPGLLLAVSVRERGIFSARAPFAAPSRLVLPKAFLHSCEVERQSGCPGSRTSQTLSDASHPGFPLTAQTFCIRATAPASVHARSLLDRAKAANIL